METYRKKRTDTGTGTKSIHYDFTRFGDSFTVPNLLKHRIAFIKAYIVTIFKKNLKNTNTYHVCTLLHWKLQSLNIPKLYIKLNTVDSGNSELGFVTNFVYYYQSTLYLKDVTLYLTKKNLYKELRKSYVWVHRMLSKFRWHNSIILTLSSIYL